MKKQHHRQENDLKYSIQDETSSHGWQEEYAYQESGIHERLGTIPVWLFIVAIILLCWGVLYIMQNWSPPVPMQ